MSVWTSVRLKMRVWAGALLAHCYREAAESHCHFLPTKTWSEISGTVSRHVRIQCTYTLVRTQASVPFVSLTTCQIHHHSIEAHPALPRIPQWQQKAKRSRVQGAWWLGALLPPGLDSSSWGMDSQVYRGIVHRILSGVLFARWGPEAGWCSRTMRWTYDRMTSRKVNPTCWRVRARITTQYRCCGMSQVNCSHWTITSWEYGWAEAARTEHPPGHRAGLIPQLFGRACLRSLLQKEVQPASLTKTWRRICVFINLSTLSNEERMCCICS